MSVQTITAQPSQIAGAYATPFLINNPSSASVYLSGDSSVRIGSQALTLPPGASCQWSGECWGVTAVGTQGNIEVAPNSGGLTAPGPTSVTLGGPVGIDPNANAISGAVGVNSNAVILFNRPSSNTNVPATQLPVTVWDSTGVNLSPYQSLVMQFGGRNMGAVDSQGSIVVVITQYDSAGNVVWVDQPGFYSTGILRYTTQLRGAKVIVTMYNANPISRNVSNITISGAASLLPHSYYQFPGNSSQYVNCSDVGTLNMPTSKVTVIQASVGASVSGIVFLETYGGPVSLQWRNSGSASSQSTHSLQTEFGVGGILFIALPNPLTAVNTNRYFQHEGFTLPEIPVSLHIDNGTVAQTIIDAFVWQ